MARSSRSSSHEGKRSSRGAQQSRQGGRREEDERDESENKSLTSVISESMGSEAQESIDRMLGEVRRYFDDAKDYVSENPKEAAGLAVACGFAAWALLGTKPGRYLFERGSGMAVPYMTRWFSTNIMGTMNH